MTEIHDRVLDALDDARPGIITGELGTVSRSLESIQSLAARLGVSDSAARRAVHRLRIEGLVEVWDVLDPTCRRRRLLVSGELA